MAAKTTWSLAPWLGNQTWLLKDNTVVKTPDIETTSSNRRARIAGTTKSVPHGDLQQLIREALTDVAKQRGTEPWVRVDSPDDNLVRHGQAAPGSAIAPDFTKSPSLYMVDDKSGRRGHTSIAFEFVSTECPTVTAIVWVYLAQDYHNDHEVRSGITYRILHEDQWDLGAGYSFWAGGGTTDWTTPFGYYDHSDEAEAAKEWLAQLDPIPGIEWLNRDFQQNPRVAVTEALKLLKQLVDVEEITLPVWRNRAKPDPMTYRFTGRTTFTGSLYREMLDFVQTKATVDRIRKNYQAILKDMAALGLVGQAARSNKFFEAVEEGFGDDLACHMIPLTTEQIHDDEARKGKVTVVPDHEHTVSVDFKTGTLVVNCLKDQKDIVEQWNFARFQAELKGELDEFLGFARQTQTKRNRKRASQIMKDRSADEADLEITKFSA